MSCLDEVRYTSVVVNGTTYRIKRSAEIDADIVDKLISWYKSVGCMYGECLMQDDEAVIQAPEILSDILDEMLRPEAMD